MEIGTARLRWLEVPENNGDRERQEWANKLREAKVLRGPQSRNDDDSGDEINNE